MTLKRFSMTLIKKAWLLVLFMAIGYGLAAFYNLYIMVPTYRAESTLHIINKEVTSKEMYLSESDISLSRLIAQDYSSIAYSRRVTSKVINILRESGMSEMDETLLRKKISVSNKKDTNIITINAEWTDRKMAVLMSNTMNSVLESTINELIGGNYAHLLDKANSPRQPIIGAKRIIIVGIIAGLFAGFAIIYIIALFDTKIRSMEDLYQIVDLDVIGKIPDHKII